jgi:hypothetical protein
MTSWTLTGMNARALPRKLTLSVLSWLIPLTIATIYLVLFVVLLPRNVTGLGWDPSVASAFVLPETLVNTGSGGHTVMGSSPQWVSLWFGLLTAKLPLHRELWGVAPTLMILVTALIVGWSVAQLAGRQAAVLAVLIALVVSPLALAFFMAPFSHNTVYPCTALLGAYLIWLTRGEGRRRWLAFVVPPIMGVVVGTCLASDLLLAATAVIPLALAAVLAGMQRDRRSRFVALSALTTVAVSIPVEKFTAATMKADGFLTLPSPLHYATLSELPARGELLFKGLKLLFNGYLGSDAPGTLHTELGFASDIVMAAALLTLLVVGMRAAAGLAWSSVRKGSVRTPAQLARSLHIAYWVGSTACACGAFWIAGEGPTTTHESYYANAIFAIAAIVPLLLFSGMLARVLIPVGVSLYFTAGLVGLADGYADITASQAPTRANIVRFAEVNHVQTGYSNFGDASGLTWGTDNRLIVRPVQECQNPEGTDLCPGFQAYVPSWYVPQRRHSFLLVDANGIEVRSLPPGLGKPLAVSSFESMSMYIYPYDIATRFGRSW